MLQSEACVVVFSLWIAMMCILVLVGRLRSGRGPKLADKPSEERNLIDRSRGAGKSSMHTLKRTGREGMSSGGTM